MKYKIFVRGMAILIKKYGYSQKRAFEKMKEYSKKEKQGIKFSFDLLR